MKDPKELIGEEDGADDAATSAQNRQLIGNEVRFWRKERGLTGARLASLAGITPSMQTKIELGNVSPSIQTLLSIAGALNVPASMFFYRIEKSRYVSFVPRANRMRVDRSGSRAGHIYEMLGHNIGHSIEISPFQVIYEEGAKPFSTFQEEGYKFILMELGKVVYRHGDKSFTLVPGDSLIFDAMAPHGPSEILEFPSKLLSVAVSSRVDPGLR